MKIKIVRGFAGFSFPYGNVGNLEDEADLKVLKDNEIVVEAERTCMNYYTMSNGKLVHVNNVVEVTGPEEPTQTAKIPRPNADVAIQWFSDNSLTVQMLGKNETWIDLPNPVFSAASKYRIKPKDPVMVKSRRYFYRGSDGSVTVGSITTESNSCLIEENKYFIYWLDEKWVEHEVPE